MLEQLVSRLLEVTISIIAAIFGPLLRYASNVLSKFSIREPAEQPDTTTSAITHSVVKESNSPRLYEVQDGLVIMGTPENPLNQEQVRTAIEQYNAEFGESVDRETLYGWTAIDQTALAGFNEALSESFESFVLRHAKRSSELLLEANNLLTDVGYPITARLDGYTQRGIIYTKNGVDVPCSMWTSCLDWTITGSDGIFYFRGYPYDPNKSYYYDEATGIDWGYIHELLGHAVAHLLDAYALMWRRYADGDPDPAVFGDIPNAWHEYYFWDRNDLLGDNLMGFCVDRLDLYLVLVLARRLYEGIFHDMAETIPEIYGFLRSLIRRNVIFQLDESLAGYRIEVYRTEAIDVNGQLSNSISPDLAREAEYLQHKRELTESDIQRLKVLRAAGVLSYEKEWLTDPVCTGIIGENGRVSLGASIDDASGPRSTPHIMYVESGTLLFKVYDESDNLVAWRTDDVRMLAISKMLNILHPSKRPVIGINLCTDPDALPRELDWTVEITYEPYPHYEFLPALFKTLSNILSGRIVPNVIATKI